MEDTQPAVQNRAAEKSVAAAQVNPAWAAWLVLAALLLLTVVREPRYFISPRFWAEEGVLHFAFSYSHPWYQALFQPQVGYLNFWPNLTTLLATLAPLEQAPLVTTLLALLVQLLPAGLILWSRSPLWAGWPRKLAGVAVLWFAPLSSEVWLNSVNSYPFLAAATFLLLIEPAPPPGPRRWLAWVVLVVAGLTNAVSCFLIPLFLLRAWLEKDRQRWLQVGLLVACTLVHIVLIIAYARMSDHASFGERLHLIGFTTLGATLWTQSLGLMATGYPWMDAWARELFEMAVNDLNGFQAWGRLLLVVSVVALLVLSHNLPLRLRVLFLSSYAALMVLTMMFTGINDKYTLIDTGLHQRLFFAPNVILGWMLVLGIHFRPDRGWRALWGNLASGLCALLLGAALLWGITGYRDMNIIKTDWPDWTAEVQAWRADPSYAPRIAPEGAVVHLVKK